MTTAVFPLVSSLPLAVALFFATASLAPAQSLPDSDEPGDTEADLSEIPALWFSARPGGRDFSPEARAAAASADVAAAPLPNLRITSIQIADGAGNPTTPTVGKGFWVRVNYTYANANCNAYTIRRAVNGWTHIAPAVDFGCGTTGTGSWIHYWGTWLIHMGGSYAITVALDSGNAVAESNEADNTVTTNITFTGAITPEWALVNAEFGRTNLGDGTDVIVGTMDDAFDYLHPWFTGNDSLGRPRLIRAVQNTLGPGGSPLNASHATAVMGIVLARGANGGDITGLAPDARYVSGEFINRANLGTLTVPHIFDAANVLVTNGAEVINMSWSWWSGTTAESESGETSLSNLMADYLSYARNIVCVPAVNQLGDHVRPTAPGSSRNVITVGGLDNTLLRAWNQQDYGPTLDGRSKPDLLGNDSANGVSPSSDWRSGFPAVEGVGGTSFAAPFVTGAIAQMIDYAKRTGRNRDHRTLKAIVMNSGVKALDDNGAAWANSSTVPLDNQQGTGILDLRRVHRMYAAGEQPPGASSVPGFDFGRVTGTNTPGTTNNVNIYRLGSPATSNADLDVTLAWDRHTSWNDANGNGRIDATDSFFVSAADAQDNLDLSLYKNGVLLAQSRSAVDTVEHVHLTGLTPGAYELRVERLSVPNSGASEDYGLAWHSNAPWTNLPPVVRITQIQLSVGLTVRITFQLVSGQTRGFQLQSTADLNDAPAWTTHGSVAAVPLGGNQFQMQLNVGATPRRFFRVSATP